MPRPAPVPAPRSAPWALVLLVAASACQLSEGGRSRGGVVEVNRLVLDGRFEEALQRADDLVRARPGDAAAAEARRDARTALLLERARRLSFEDQDDRALQQVDAALAEDPESEVALAWRQRLLHKLAERWFQRGRDAHAQGLFEASEEAYRKALDYRPDHPLAQNQLGDLRTYLGWRRQQAQEYYNDGVRSFAGDRLSEARSGFESSRKYEDGDVSRTERRIEEVRREAALVAKERAKTQAASGYWHSAARAIDDALDLDPGLAAGAELRAGYAREARVADLRREAELARLRGQHDKARELLGEARGLTQEQGEQVTKELALVDDSEIDRQYETALALEYDFRYEEAVAAYGALLERREYYKDARARLGTLENAVRIAADLYRQAAAAATVAEKVELYRQIELVWPEYRDVRELLGRLDPDGARTRATPGSDQP